MWLVCLYKFNVDVCTFWNLTESQIGFRCPGFKCLLHNLIHSHSCQPLFVRVSQHSECYLMRFPFWACNKYNVVCDGWHKTMTVSRRRVLLYNKPSLSMDVKKFKSALRMFLLEGSFYTIQEFLNWGSTH